MSNKLRNPFKPDFKNDPDSMLRLIIWIAAVSITVIMVLSWGLVYRVISSEIIRDAKETAVKIGKAVLQQEAKLLIATGRDGEPVLHIDPKDLPKVDRFFREFFPSFDILKLKIYDLDHRIIYCSEAAIIGKVDSGNRMLAKALRGEVDTNLVKKGSMLDLQEETRLNVEVVETYIPIKVGRKIIGSFEIYTDVTSYRHQIFETVSLTILALAAIVCTVFAFSYLIIRKATGLLKETQNELAGKVVQLEEALANVKQLEGIIPICSYCHKIRDDVEKWQQLELYISSRSDAHFSHGICPDCYQEQLRELELID